MLALRRDCPNVNGNGRERAVSRGFQEDMIKL